MTGWPLEDGEELLWEGRPSTGFSLEPVRGTVTQIGWLFAGLTVLMGGLTAFIEPGFVGGTVLIMALSGGLIVLLIGWGNRSRRKGHEYAVTDRRALIRYLKTPLYGRAFIPYDPEGVQVRPGAVPSVLVGRGPLVFSGEAGGNMLTFQDFVLEMVDEAEGLADLLRKAAARNAPDRPDPVQGVQFTATCRNWRIRDE